MSVQKKIKFCGNQFSATSDVVHEGDISMDVEGQIDSDEAESAKNIYNRYKQI